MKAEPRGIQSVEIAGQILKLLALQSRPLSLTEIGELMDSPPATIFTYLVSLVRSRLLKRDPVTQKYEPGPLALRLGMDALYSDPIVKNAIAALDRFGRQHKLNVFASVWTQIGPVVIFCREYGMVMNLGFKQGSVFSLTHTATGKLFAAFTSAALCLEVIEKQIVIRDDLARFNSDIFQQELAGIRRTSLSVSQRIPTPSVSAIAAPVTDSCGNIVLAISVFSPSHLVDQPKLAATGDMLLAEALALSGGNRRESHDQ